MIMEKNVPFLKECGRMKFKTKQNGKITVDL